MGRANLMRRLFSLESMCIPKSAAVSSCCVGTTTNALLLSVDSLWASMGYVFQCFSMAARVGRLGGGCLLLAADSACFVDVPI